MSLPAKKQQELEILKRTKGLLLTKIEKLLDAQDKGTAEPSADAVY